MHLVSLTTCIMSLMLFFVRLTICLVELIMNLVGLIMHLVELIMCLVGLIEYSVSVKIRSVSLLIPTKRAYAENHVVKNYHARIAISQT